MPLAVAGVADYLSMGVAYGLNQGFGTSVSGQSSGIMTILVFGAGTDYALLLVSRYREELRRVERPYDAMAAALRGCGPAVWRAAATWMSRDGRSIRAMAARLFGRSAPRRCEQALRGVLERCLISHG